MAFYRSNRGLKWHYDVHGSGEPVLFIHGFGGSGRWWHHQIAFLDTFQTITIDLPGHGQSEWMPVNVQDMAVDIRQIINSLGLPHVSIVASSFGGLIAIELFRLLAGDVMRMSLVGALPKFARSEQYPAGLDIPRIRTMGRQFEGDYAPVLDMFFRSLFTMQERNSPQFKELKRLRAGETLPRREALLSFLDILEKTDLRDRIATVICPLQFISGSDDYICPPSIMAWMAEHTYNARFDTMAKCGHLPFLTDVKEYNRLLEDFLIS